MSRVQSIERAFAVLSALGDGPLGVTVVAERVRLPKSTVARLLAALVAEGAVEQLPGGTDYRIGERLVGLAAGVQPTRSLVAITRPQLVDLALLTGEAAGLSIPDGFTVHYVDQEDSPNPVAVRDWTGVRLPFHVTSAGLVILAHCRNAEVERFLAQPLERFTALTVTDPAVLRERIRRARVDGFAWTRDEFAEGISSIAAAIAGPDGEAIGAIHVHGPSYRFPAADDPGGGQAVADAVVAAAARITASLRRAG